MTRPTDPTHTPRRVRASAKELRSGGLFPQLLRIYHDSLARTSGLIVVTITVTAVLGFGYWIVAARAYSAGAVGTAAVSISAMLMANLLSILGVEAALIQRIPSRALGHQWDLTVTSSLLVAGSSGLAAGFLGWRVIVLVLHAASLRNPLYGIALTAGVGLTNCGSVLDSVWVVEQSTQIRLLTNTVMSVVKLPLLLLPIFRSDGAVGIQLSWTVSLVIAVGLGLALLHRRQGYRPRLSGLRREVRSVRASMAGNYIVTIGAAAPSYVVPILVGTLVSLANTAYFYSAWRVGSFFFVGGLAVSTALFAEQSRNPDRAIQRARQALRLIVPLLVLATAGMAVIGGPFLSAFGPEYRDHALLLLLLLVGTAVPDALNIVYLTTLLVQRRYVQASCFIWSLATAQIVLTLILVRALGIDGAGVAWLLSECLGVLIQAVERVLRGRPRDPQRGSPSQRTAEEGLNDGPAG